MSGSPGAPPVRDAWIGWTERGRGAGLQRVLRHSRFPVFPWVRVGNLASRSLAPTTGAGAGARPLPAETFAGPRERGGSRHPAAGWTGIGAPRAPRDVYASGLEPGARAAPRRAAGGRGRDAVFRPRRDANAETTVFSAGATAGIRPDRRAMASPSRTWPRSTGRAGASGSTTGPPGGSWPPGPSAPGAGAASCRNPAPASSWSPPPA